jgi:hypothetical protein
MLCSSRCQEQFIKSVYPLSVARRTDYFQLVLNGAILTTSKVNGLHRQTVVKLSRPVIYKVWVVSVSDKVWVVSVSDSSPRETPQFFKPITTENRRDFFVVSILPPEILVTGHCGLPPFPPLPMTIQTGLQLPSTTFIYSME